MLRFVVVSLAITTAVMREDHLAGLLSSSGGLGYDGALRFLAGLMIIRRMSLFHGSWFIDLPEFIFRDGSFGRVVANLQHFMISRLMRLSYSQHLRSRLRNRRHLHLWSRLRNRRYLHLRSRLGNMQYLHLHLRPRLHLTQTRLQHLRVWIIMTDDYWRGIASSFSSSSDYWECLALFLSFMDSLNGKQALEQ